jgi:hypothetical protein
MEERSLEEIAREVALLVEDKQRQYGNSFGKSARILEVLYPEGVKVEDYQNLLTLTRILDKLFRIATNNGNDKEDPWRDICGYSLLALQKSDKD